MSTIAAIVEFGATRNDCLQFDVEFDAPHARPRPAVALLFLAVLAMFSAPPAVAVLMLAGWIR